jgi:hypothetical protein
MQYSRTSIVAMLIAVEIVLAGLMIFVVRGGFNGGNVFAANGMHRVSFAALPIAPIAAGATPHVLIDDRDSFVTVKASYDALVHAVDTTRVGGAIFGNTKIAQLKMTRTGDGVRIERPESADGFLSFGSISQSVTVEVPTGAHVEIVRSSGADVRGMDNTVNVASQDGHISLAQIRGDIDAHSDDGHIDATDIHGNSVKLSTSDGRLVLADITAAILDARTNDGRIEAQRLSVEGTSPRATLHTGDGSMHVGGRFAAGGAYELTTDDGRVELALDPGSDVTVNASTDDGSLYVDGQSYSGESKSTHTARVGAGTGSLRVSSGSGSMHITTNGAF